MNLTTFSVKGNKSIISAAIRFAFNFETKTTAYIDKPALRLSDAFSFIPVSYPAFLLITRLSPQATSFNHNNLPEYIFCREPVRYGFHQTLVFQGTTKIFLQNNTF